MSGYQIGIGDLEGFEQYAAKESDDWKWSLTDLAGIPKNGIKVFSCFACGGGSTMGYKLAGCEVIGCCEIDRRMNDIYVANHNPKYNYVMDIRDFNVLPNHKLPDELFDLDILDGSPPCTPFSLSGQRDRIWSVKKRFREGQVEQTLDDLPFVFIDTVKKLKPRAVIMENVAGILAGTAFNYVRKIHKQFADIGYQVRHFLLRSEVMGIPQARHRVFFIALRNDIDCDLHSLNMGFNYKPIPYKIIKSGTGARISEDSKTYGLLQHIKKGDHDLSDAHKRIYGKESMFNTKILYDDEVCCTLTAGSTDFFRYGEWTRITKADLISAATFPIDFNFVQDTMTNVCYVTGMSVPPIMIKRIVERLLTTTNIFEREK